MVSVLIIARQGELKADLRDGLSHGDLKYFVTAYASDIGEAVAARRPDLLLFEMDGATPDSNAWETVRKLSQKKRLPLVVIIPAEALNSTDGRLECDDFILSPCDGGELNLRINRLLRPGREVEGHQLIKRDGLTIDLDTCEVTIAGKLVELTFKEYELLKLMAGNPGRVYTRQALLDKLWGYDYYGGDRTVDVHVRRLRSKIEDAEHTFVETVRNIGYRFRAR
jgi:two-component system alkaline phosphatase synthesis response regulator PhoP